MVDSVVRLIPGVIREGATQSESFSFDSLEYSQYTRPQSFGGSKVPEILLSGNHREIEQWKEKISIKKTKKRKMD